MLKFGTHNIGKVFFGSHVIGKAFYGSNLVYQVGGTPLPYDAQVEYIATDGNQYIDLGIIGNAATDALYIDFQATTAKTQARLIAANRTAAPCQIYVNGSGKAGYRQASSWGGPAIPDEFGTTRHTWLCDYLNLRNTIDGADYAMDTASTGTSYTSLLLAGPYTNQNKFVGRIYACKIYRSGTLLLDLIPVRIGTVGQMYDRVSGAFFTNAGTGAYTYGNDIT